MHINRSGGVRSTKSVQDTHISEEIRLLHGALADIHAVMNRPQRDEMMVKEAGISLDRALFPLLVGIARLGPIGVVDLADRVGRDYTTVSRQVARLQGLGLVERQTAPAADPPSADRRVRRSVVTPKGRAMTDAVDAARDRLGRAIFASWDLSDLETFVRLTRRFADALNDPPPLRE
jgi:DNA-binding MarR family transcriptional regulator